MPDVRCWFDSVSIARRMRSARSRASETISSASFCALVTRSVAWDSATRSKDAVCAPSLVKSVSSFRSLTAVSSRWTSRNRCFATESWPSMSRM